MSASEGSRYSADFLEWSLGQGAASAERLVPLILEYIRPRSVVDVGCGLGAWLATFREHGVHDLWGLDGSYVDRSALVIDPDRFRPVDLAGEFTAPCVADLAISLEVAEHLPEPSAAGFVKSLTEAAPVVLFSAAVPGQQGVSHVNEQWPDYWADLFHRFGYGPVDCLRDRIWDDDEVAWWYAQNILFYVDRARIADYASLASHGFAPTVERRLHPCHPKLRWETDRARVREAIERHVGSGPLILVDDGKLSLDLGPDRVVRPFLEREGSHWGAASDDEEAVSEVERMRAEGAEWLAFAPHSYWWLDHYEGFAGWLRERWECVVDDDVVIFDLQELVLPEPESTIP